MKPICIEPDCLRPHNARGYCMHHYDVRRWAGDLPPIPRLTALERMADRIRYEADCWIWTGSLFPNGYGSIRHQGKGWLAHRLSYTLHEGPIPDGLVLDHLCRVHACVNPTHLEAVPQRVNVLRGMAPVAVAIRTGLCIRGHELKGDNLYTPPGDPRQSRCRECLKVVRRERYQRDKARNRA